MWATVSDQVATKQASSVKRNIATRGGGGDDAKSQNNFPFVFSDLLQIIRTRARNEDGVPVDTAAAEEDLDMQAGSLRVAGGTSALKGSHGLTRQTPSQAFVRPTCVDKLGRKGTARMRIPLDSRPALACQLLLP